MVGVSLGQYPWGISRSALATSGTARSHSVAAIRGRATCAVCSSHHFSSSPPAAILGTLQSSAPRRQLPRLGGASLFWLAFLLGHPAPGRERAGASCPHRPPPAGGGRLLGRPGPSPTVTVSGAGRVVDAAA